MPKSPLWCGSTPLTPFRNLTRSRYRRCPGAASEDFPNYQGVVPGYNAKVCVRSGLVGAVRMCQRSNYEADRVGALTGVTVRLVLAESHYNETYVT
ncbi:hypothetical protein DQ04_00921110 [Trypanosoma grayi]|uniref:hypothetical protein n=1 Tax=Trypanosoma grayi TaxID=71804 RepID=UPI0004F426DF|nr:hypothetical protein DQ04_00921110 [Trypanosoma grayi]KEG13577.1 hypothetical protein DQ04_00921110 [Trypanosoma grayi]